MNLYLISHTKNPLETLYTAYRICYSSKPISEVIEQIKAGEITQQQIKKFLRKMFKTGHTSPMRQLHFVFGVEGVSRVTTAQFNRHTVGVDRTEMSQRYIDVGDSAWIEPASIANKYDVISHALKSFVEYECMIESGIPQEDARYILPMGTESREQFSMSLEAVRHFLSVRMCECAQWEIREMAWKIYKIMRKKFPLLSSILGPKCWENQLGYCDEDEKKHSMCSMIRPHKHRLMRLWKND